MEVPAALPSPLLPIFPSNKDFNIFYYAEECPTTTTHLLADQLGTADLPYKANGIFHLFLQIALTTVPTLGLRNDQVGSPIDSLLNLSRQRQVLEILLFQLRCVYNPAMGHIIQGRPLTRDTAEQLICKEVCGLEEEIKWESLKDQTTYPEDLNRHCILLEDPGGAQGLHKSCF